MTSPASGVRLFTLALVALVGAEAAITVLDAAFPPDLGREARSSPVALDRRGGWLRALPVEDGRWRIRADLDRTDPNFLRRLVALEDARFADHPGVDALAVLRAAGSAAVHGRIVSGASTLTMQTAKLLEPRPRNLGSKLIEMARAVQIEARLSKRQVLAAYLTLAPYGGNLEGGAASLAYFGHEPETLTGGEQALLIALPQSPEARRPDRHPETARAARETVLARLVRARLISPAEAAEAAAEPLPRRSPFPALAWHAAGQAAAAARADQASVVTTLDAPLQARLEALAAQTAAAQGEGADAAILVIEIKGRAVRAAVGGAGLERPGGWMDMTTALRSPGSTLKPFIYGFAFDDGVAAPDTEIDDAPRRYDDYEPENFDRVFHGRVTAREALTYSLNVPAGGDPGAAGPRGLRGADRIGGGAAGAAGRADGGGRPAPGARGRGRAAAGTSRCSMRPSATAAWPSPWPGPRPRPPARAGQPGVRIMRPEAARQVLDILRETPAPKGRAPAALTRLGPRMAFKTGTSYGFRDALAAGVVGGYVVIAWTGRADGGARGGPDRARRRPAPAVRRRRRHRRPPLRPASDRAALRPAGPGRAARDRGRAAPGLSPRRRHGAGRRPGPRRARPGPGRPGRGAELVCRRRAPGRRANRAHGLAAGRAGVLPAGRGRRRGTQGRGQGADHRAGGVTAATGP